MTPWSIGWRIDAVFGCKKTNWMFVKLKMGGCTGDLSMITSIFLSSTRNFRSSLRTPCSKIWLSIQLFFCATYWKDKCLTFLKEPRFFDLPIQKQSSGGVLRNFSEFTGKHLCQNLLLIKLLTCNFVKKETLAQVVSCEFCWKFLKTPFFVEHLWWLLLYSYFAFLLSRAFVPFEIIDFIRNTLAEEARFISIKYILQNISLNIYKYLFQELIVSSVTDLHLPPITLSEILCLKKIEFASWLQNYKSL